MYSIQDNDGAESLELLDIIGHNLAESDNYCSPRYWIWETLVAIPALNNLGYEIVGSFYTLEGDSCGPLVRGIRVSKDGSQRLLTYG